jgi:hypothetical protein
MSAKLETSAYATAPEGIETAKVESAKEDGSAVQVVGTKSVSVASIRSDHFHVLPAEARFAVIVLVGILTVSIGWGSVRGDRPVGGSFAGRFYRYSVLSYSRFYTAAGNGRFQSNP